MSGGSRGAPGAGVIVLSWPPVGTARLGAAASGFSCSGTGSSLAYSSCVRTTGDSAISTCAAQGRHTRTRTVGSVCRKRDGWRGSGA
eukprot:scaffold13325_cov75-Phaeocystis_antarctica.AAC.2